MQIHTLLILLKDPCVQPNIVDVLQRNLSLQVIDIAVLHEVKNMTTFEIITKLSDMPR